MAYTQDDLDNLKRAIATGAREVEYNGERVSYRSTADMLRLQAIMERELAAASTGAGPRRVAYTNARGLR